METRAVYYKICAGIDAYPLLLEHTLINSAEDLYESLFHLATTYKAMHLFKIDQARITKFRELNEQKQISAFFLTDQDTLVIYQFLEENYLLEKISVSEVVSCLLRVALDTRTHGFINHDDLKNALESFRKANNPKNHDILATIVLTESFVKVFD